MTARATCILAIDPGSERSAVVCYDREDHIPFVHYIESNDTVERAVRAASTLDPVVTCLVIESMAPRGMPTSADEMKAIYWSGIFAGAWGPKARYLVTRRDVKRVICGTTAANDSNVRQAVIDRFGGDAAIGRKASPGPCYGIKRDEWQALALALAWCELSIYQETT